MIIALTSCNSYDKKIESWYELFPGDNPVDTVLKRIVEYDRDGNILSEKVYYPEIGTFLRCSYYDSLGQLKQGITFYDSLMNNKEIVIYEYKDYNILRQTIKNLRNDKVVRSMTTNYENTFDSLGRLSKSVLHNEIGLSSYYEYNYNQNNKIISMLYKVDSTVIMKENNSYNEDGTLSEYNFDFPSENRTSRQLHYYTNTLLTKSITLLNSDTFKIETFVYNEKDILEEVLIEENSWHFGNEKWYKRLVKEEEFIVEKK